MKESKLKISQGMSRRNKLILGAGIGVVAIGTATYLIRLNKMNAELESVPTVSVHSVKLTGLTIRLDVKLKNPTRMGFSFKFPFMKVLYKDAVIGTSKVVNSTIKIPAYGEVNISAIMIAIPLTSVLTTAKGLVATLLQKKTDEVTIKTITTLDLGWKKLPYTKVDKFPINNTKKA